MRPIFDAHLDLAWNAVSFDRDLTQPIELIRQRESAMTDHPSRGRNTVSLPELRRAGVAVCVATLLARSGQDVKPSSDPKPIDLDYASPALACDAARRQLAYYELLEQQGHARIIRTAGELATHWKSPKTIGIILSMEGADPITEPTQVQHWWDQGLRAIGLAHYGRGQYACGTGTGGPLSDRGIELLREMQRVGMILDVTHLSDTSMQQALEIFSGPVLASHHNCRTLVPRDRQLTDEQIRVLVDRDAVIGVALDAWMLHPGWERGVTKPDAVAISAAVDHIDRVCQLAGNTRHIGIGSDLDGGFGTEQTPRELNTIADLQKLVDILSSRGYADVEINAIFHGNWLRFFRDALPA
ncbi:MAG: membrane dipeptidase [Anaerolineae bacterium]|nr:membrane dipeptidase [Phycisphaerae bacterium]